MQVDSLFAPTPSHCVLLDRVICSRQERKNAQLRVEVNSEAS